VDSGRGIAQHSVRRSQRRPRCRCHCRWPFALETRTRIDLPYFPTGACRQPRQARLAAVNPPAPSPARRVQADGHRGRGKIVVGEDPQHPASGGCSSWRPRGSTCLPRASARPPMAVLSCPCLWSAPVHSGVTMRLLMVAYPGAGKGTQAEMLADHYRIAHLSSGTLLRAEVNNDTRIGRVAADFLRRGDLVPDEIVFEMLRTPVLEAARNGGYVLDGFPRTLHQAEAAYSVAQEIEDVELQAAVYLKVGQNELRKRLRARAGQEGRTDDDDVAIAHRFEVFEVETEPLLAFYAGRGILLEINGEQPVGDVFGDITSAVDSLHLSG
jgi:adenylate kinase